MGGEAPLSDARRLADEFAVGSSVEVALEDRCGVGRWTPGAIVRHAHPGVWVRTPDGLEWFVTSAKRIRPRPE